MAKRAAAVARLVFLLSICVPLLAQNAALVGTVTDAQQAAVANARVTLTNLAMGVPQTATTNETGIYEFPRVRPGTYSLKIEQAGFKTFIKDKVEVAINSTVRVDVSLEVGGVIINDVPSWRVDHMPYGGVKESGQGREGVRFAMEEMTEIRLFVLRTPTARPDRA
jgi:hypothetical protein